jgi:hypothetical protein
LSTGPDRLSHRRASSLCPTNHFTAQVGTMTLLLAITYGVHFFEPKRD